jgi:hypothetical protein
MTATSTRIIFGVRKPLANWNPFWANLQVYDYLLFDARRTRRWRDKLGIWFRRTGWRPADVDARFPKRRVNLAAFEKFDPGVPQPVQRYVLAQFGVAVAATLALGALYAAAGAKAVLVPCILLWAQLYTLGLLNEGRPYAMRFEGARLLVIVPAGVLVIAATGLLPVAPSWLWGGTAIYLAGSLTGLHRTLREGNKIALKQSLVTNR